MLELFLSDWSPSTDVRAGLLTLMFWLRNQFAHHRLDDPNVAIWFPLGQHLLSKPPKARPASAIQKLVERPTMSNETIVPVQPMSKTGLRPIRSERPPQKKPVRLSARAKAEMKMPA
ncbi:MAG: hypothetical protein Q9191_004806 [Dirinaria sp. TL-2023a]